ncbi:MAG: hypothetical protein A2583_03140 [Bdellovibrionales bacterium RIFOXYD1_FULL_53_11]|nr:MAG: hypothetical protein A2583_03140 [Bdellovibrionales bacterium RIFOXYD1_FULL_53_11]
MEFEAEEVANGCNSFFEKIFKRFHAVVHEWRRERVLHRAMKSSGRRTTADNFTVRHKIVVTFLRPGVNWSQEP